MNAIIGLDKIALRDPNISEVTRDELEKIGSSARHLLSLINDILDMSRIESGRMVLKQEEFSFGEFLDQISIIINGQCEDKGLTFECNRIGDKAGDKTGDKAINKAGDKTGALDEYFIGDDLRLKQVLINILGNAVKFTDAPGKVTFTAEQLSAADGEKSSAGTSSSENAGSLQQDGAQHLSGADNSESADGLQNTDTAGKRLLRFTIKDTGIGMDKSFIPRLFDAFAQEDATSTNRYGGSGLGMAITRNMVDLMGGRIEVDSEKGKGTTFTVYIPLMKASRAEAGAETGTAAGYGAAGAGSAEDIFGQNGQAGQGVSLEGLHVLIVEDMELNAEILADLLELEDMTTEWAENGRQAVELFEQNEAGHFDAILMDMRMPVMDGPAATRAIRALAEPDADRSDGARPDAATIPIIALTANAFDEDVKTCLEAGMNAHMSKPVDIEELKELLGRML
jgi:signal transduction histidine kinase/AmiR/NasT family two-component response regulator